MILYTTVPEELMFQPDQAEFSKQKVVTINSVPVVTAEVSPGKYQIVRILSTDPGAFLKSSLAPGQMVGMDQVNS
ncbi:YlzJ-like family protein [Bacillus marinisedimentorum]|uniref:YlzJ-like family protein n=1 Tax=Bacillus marinisedimentorum TaxID=1821260 RepID=UPI0007DFCA32|nr:YlzJ-like family protein [Bacillus marinisedimentorum]